MNYDKEGPEAMGLAFVLALYTGIAFWLGPWGLVGGVLYYFSKAVYCAIQSARKSVHTSPKANHVP